MPKETLNFKLDLEKQSKWLFISANLDVKNRLPYIQEIGDFYCLEEYFTQRKDLESYYISYTVSGGGILEYKGETHTISQFQTFWIDCEEYQRYYTDPDIGHWNQIWIHFYGASCREYYELFLAQNNQSNIVNMSGKNRLQEKIEQLLELYEHGNNLSIDTYAISILTDIMTQCIISTSRKIELSSFPDFVVKAVSFLQDHYAEDISLDRIADRFAVNKYYFHRTFKKYIGVTPNDYLITTRLNKAKELLRTTDIQINQIAAMVGIENVSHFINTFKKHEGVTPYEYSKNWYWK